MLGVTPSRWSERCACQAVLFWSIVLQNLYYGFLAVAGMTTSRSVQNMFRIAL
ncbi:hypothetical protein B0H12DRAFT_1098096 [Mycena haematopus]|nr:hypothetical protein B0H12DRAFT_1098096 [Mycena haematopus]